jgi:hypothetical protein
MPNKIGLNGDNLSGHMKIFADKLFLLPFDQFDSVDSGQPQVAQKLCCPVRINQPTGVKINKIIHK